MAKRLGELLVESGASTPSDIDEALAAQSGGEPERLGEILVGWGRLAPASLARALAQQSGLPFIELSPIPAEVSDLVPLDLQVQNRLTPFEVEHGAAGSVLHLAIADPGALAMVEELSMQIGMALKVYVASSDQIEAAHAAYQGQDPIVWPHPSPGLPTAPVAPIPEAPKLPPAAAAVRLKVPHAPVKPLPRGPNERPRTSPPAPAPPAIAAPQEKRGTPIGVASTARTEPVASPEPLAGLALPEWLSEPAGGVEPRPLDRALQLKLETLLAHGGTGTPSSAWAAVVALLIRRGLLREHEVLDALGRK